jgi:hypothetical protein
MADMMAAAAAAGVAVEDMPDAYNASMGGNELTLTQHNPFVTAAEVYAVHAVYCFLTRPRACSGALHLPLYHPLHHSHICCHEPASVTPAPTTPYPSLCSPHSPCPPTLVIPRC